MTSIRRSRYFRMLSAILWFVMCGLAEAQAEVTYLGEFCVVDDSPLGRPPLPLYKIGVLNYGDDHFVLNGSSIGLPAAVVGTGLIDGSNFVATLTSSYVSDTNGPSYTVSYVVVNLQESFSVRFGNMTAMITTFQPSPAQSTAFKYPYMSSLAIHRGKTMR